jgi:hypothetical protein
MAQLNRITRCTQWYDLNLTALRPREIIRAAGWGTGLFGIVFTLFPRLFGLPIRTGTLFPAEVTVIWDVPFDEVDIPDELSSLGFTNLHAFELPEFSGDNVTVLLADRDRRTFCEVVAVRMEGEHQTAVSFSSYFPGKPPSRIRTVQSWKANPLDQPEGYYNQCVPGTLTETYEAHRAWLSTFPTTAIETTWQNFLDRNHADHRFLCDYYAERRVWIDARDEDVDRLLRQKRLREG